PLTRAALRERLDRAGVPTEGQALVHVLMLATLRGLTVRGPMRGGEQAYVLVDDWLGPQAPVDRDRALAELARRYLAGHGPADDRDLAKWAGIGLRDARAGLAGIAAELAEPAPGIVDLAGRPPRPPALPPPRLLGPFDPLLHGWVSREDVLAGRQGIVTSNGVFRPIALAGGRAVATWRMPAGAVQLEPFEPLDGATSAALQAEATAVERFLSAPSA
ncbi:MAG TPA: crosslink repair DNA glycosylase YcaQ family protein, partial [Solirubrobacteraceae bacterium]